MAVNIGNIKKLLRITDTSEDTILNLLIRNTKQQIKNLLEDVDILPIELEYVIEEIVVTRYNRMMVEGLQSPNGISISNPADVEPYMSAIMAYKGNNIGIRFK